MNGAETSEEVLRTLATRDLFSERDTRKLLFRLTTHQGLRDPASGSLLPAPRNLALLALLGSRPISTLGVLRALLTVPEGGTYGREIARRAARELGVAARRLDQGRSYSVRVGELLDALTEIGVVERSDPPAGAQPRGARALYRPQPRSRPLLERLAHSIRLDDHSGDEAGTGTARTPDGGGARPALPAGPESFRTEEALPYTAELVHDLTSPQVGLDLPTVLELLGDLGAIPSARRTVEGAHDRAQSMLRARGLETAARALAVRREMGRGARRTADLASARDLEKARRLLQRELRSLGRGLRLDPARAEDVARTGLRTASRISPSEGRALLVPPLLRAELRHRYRLPERGAAATVRNLARRSNDELQIARGLLQAGLEAEAGVLVESVRGDLVVAALLTLGYLPPREAEPARGLLLEVASEPATLVERAPRMRPVDRVRLIRLATATPNGDRGPEPSLGEPTRWKLCVDALATLGRLAGKAAPGSTHAARAKVRGDPPVSGAETGLRLVAQLNWDRDFPGVLLTSDRLLHRLQEAPATERRSARWSLLRAALLRERAGALVESDRAAEARAALDEAVRRLRLLANGRSPSSSTLLLLGGALARRSELNAGAGRSPEALADLRSARGAFRRAHAPRSRRWEVRRNDLLLELTLGDHLLLAGRPSEALRPLQRAVRGLAALEETCRGSEDEVRQTNARMNLARALVSLATALGSDGRGDEAVLALRGAVSHLELADHLAHGRNPVVLRWSALAHRSLAELLKGQRKGRNARDHLRWSKEFERAAKALGSLGPRRLGRGPPRRRGASGAGLGPTPELDPSMAPSAGTAFELDRSLLPPESEGVWPTEPVGSDERLVRRAVFPSGPRVARTTGPAPTAR